MRRPAKASKADRRRASNSSYETLEQRIRQLEEEILGRADRRDREEVSSSQTGSPTLSASLDPSSASDCASGRPVDRWRTWQSASSGETVDSTSVSSDHGKTTDDQADQAKRTEVPDAVVTKSEASPPRSDELLLASIDVGRPTIDPSPSRDSTVWKSQPSASSDVQNPIDVSGGRDESTARDLSGGVTKHEAWRSAKDESSTGDGRKSSPMSIRSLKRRSSSVEQNPSATSLAADFLSTCSVTKLESEQRSDLVSGSAFSDSCISQSNFNNIRMHTVIAYPFILGYRNDNTNHARYEDDEEEDSPKNSPEEGMSGCIMGGNGDEEENRDSVEKEREEDEELLRGSNDKGDESDEENGGQKEEQNGKGEGRISCPQMVTRANGKGEGRISCPQMVTRASELSWSPLRRQCPIAEDDVDEDEGVFRLPVVQRQLPICNPTAWAQQPGQLDCSSAAWAQQIRQPNFSEADLAQQIGQPNFNQAGLAQQSGQIDCSRATWAQQIRQPNFSEADLAQQIGQPNFNQAGLAQQSGQIDCSRATWAQQIRQPNFCEADLAQQIGQPNFNQAGLAQQPGQLGCNRAAWAQQTRQPNFDQAAWTQQTRQPILNQAAWVQQTRQPNFSQAGLAQQSGQIDCSQVALSQQIVQTDCRLANLAQTLARLQATLPTGGTQSQTLPPVTSICGNLVRPIFIPYPPPIAPDRPTEDGNPPIGPRRRSQDRQKTRKPSWRDNSISDDALCIPHDDDDLPYDRRESIGGRRRGSSSGRCSGRSSASLFDKESVRRRESSSTSRKSDVARPDGKYAISDRDMCILEDVLCDSGILNDCPRNRRERGGSGRRDQSSGRSNWRSAVSLTEKESACGSDFRQESAFESRRVGVPRRGKYTLTKRERSVLEDMLGDSGLPDDEDLLSDRREYGRSGRSSGRSGLSSEKERVCRKDCSSGSSAADTKVDVPKVDVMYALTDRDTQTYDEYFFDTLRGQPEGKYHAGSKSHSLVFKISPPEPQETDQKEDENHSRLSVVELDHEARGRRSTNMTKRHSIPATKRKSWKSFREISGILKGMEAKRSFMGKHNRPLKSILRASEYGASDADLRHSIVETQNRPRKSLRERCGSRSKDVDSRHSIKGTRKKSPGSFRELSGRGARASDSKHSRMGTRKESTGSFGELSGRGSRASDSRHSITGISGNRPREPFRELSGRGARDSDSKHSIMETRKESPGSFRDLSGRESRASDSRHSITGISGNRPREPFRELSGRGARDSDSKHSIMGARKESTGSFGELSGRGSRDSDSRHSVSAGKHRRRESYREISKKNPRVSVSKLDSARRNGHRESYHDLSGENTSDEAALPVVENRVQPRKTKDRGRNGKDSSKSDHKEIFTSQVDHKAGLEKSKKGQRRQKHAHSECCTLDGEIENLESDAPGPNDNRRQDVECFSGTDVGLGKDRKSGCVHVLKYLKMKKLQAAREKGGILPACKRIAKEGGSRHNDVRKRNSGVSAEQVSNRKELRENVAKRKNKSSKESIQESDSVARVKKGRRRGSTSSLRAVGNESRESFREHREMEDKIRSRLSPRDARKQPREESRKHRETEGKRGERYSPHAVRKQTKETVREPRERGGNGSRYPPHAEGNHSRESFREQEERERNRESRFEENETGQESHESHEETERRRGSRTSESETDKFDEDGKSSFATDPFSFEEKRRSGNWRYLQHPIAHYMRSSIENHEDTKSSESEKSIRDDKRGDKEDAKKDDEKGDKEDDKNDDQKDVLDQLRLGLAALSTKVRLLGMKKCVCCQCSASQCQGQNDAFPCQPPPCPPPTCRPPPPPPPCAPPPKCRSGGDNLLAPLPGRCEGPAKRICRGRTVTWRPCGDQPRVSRPGVCRKAIANGPATCVGTGRRTCPVRIIFNKDYLRELLRPCVPQPAQPARRCAYTSAQKCVCPNKQQSDVVSVYFCCSRLSGSGPVLQQETPKCKCTCPPRHAKCPTFKSAKASPLGSLLDGEKASSDAANRSLTGSLASRSLNGSAPSGSPKTPRSTQELFVAKRRCPGWRPAIRKCVPCGNARSRAAGDGASSGEFRISGVAIDQADTKPGVETSKALFSDQPSYSSLIGGDNTSAGQVQRDVQEVVNCLVDGATRQACLSQISSTEVGSTSVDGKAGSISVVGDSSRSQPSICRVDENTIPGGNRVCSNISCPVAGQEPDITSGDNAGSESQDSRFGKPTVPGQDEICWAGKICKICPVDESATRKNKMGSTVPGSRVAGPDERRSASSGGRTSSQAGTITSTQEEIKGESSPSQAVMSPSLTGSMPCQASSRSSQPGMSPSQAGSSPSQAGSSPSQAGSSPSQAGSSPSQAGSSPSQAGSSPSQAGSSPSQAGTTASQAGKTPSRAESGTSQPGVKPCQDKAFDPLATDPCCRCGRFSTGSDSEKSRPPKSGANVPPGPRGQGYDYSNRDQDLNPASRLRDKTIRGSIDSSTVRHDDSLDKFAKSDPFGKPDEMVGDTDQENWRSGPCECSNQTPKPFPDQRRDDLDLHPPSGNREQRILGYAEQDLQKVPFPYQTRDMDRGPPPDNLDQKNIACPGQDRSGPQQGIPEQPQAKKDGFQCSCCRCGQKEVILDQPHAKMDLGFPRPTPDERNVANPCPYCNGLERFPDQPQAKTDLGFPSPSPDERNVAYPCPYCNGLERFPDQPQAKTDLGFPSPTPDERNVAYPCPYCNGLERFPDQPQAKTDLGFPSPTPDQPQEKTDLGFPRPTPDERNVAYPCPYCNGLERFPDQPQAKTDLGFPSPTPDQPQEKTDLGFPSPTDQRNIAYPGPDRDGIQRFPDQPQAKTDLGFPSPTPDQPQEKTDLGFPRPTPDERNVAYPCPYCNGLERFPDQPQAKTDLGFPSPTPDQPQEKTDLGFPSPTDQRNIAYPGPDRDGIQRFPDQPQAKTDLGFPSPTPDQPQEKTDLGFPSPTDQRNIAYPGPDRDGIQRFPDQPQAKTDLGFPSPTPDQPQEKTDLRFPSPTDQINIAYPGPDRDGIQRFPDQPQAKTDLGFPSPTPDQPQEKTDLGFPSPTPDQRNIAIPGQSLGGQQGILDQPQTKMDFGFPSPTDQRNIAYPGPDRDGLERFPDQPQAKTDLGFPSPPAHQRNISYPGQDRSGQQQGIPDQNQPKIDFGFPNLFPDQRNIADPVRSLGGQQAFPDQPQAKLDLGFPSPTPDERNVAYPGPDRDGLERFPDQPQPKMDFGFPSPKPDQRNIAIPGQSLGGQQGILDQPQTKMDFGFLSPKPDQRNIAIPGQSLGGQQGILDQPQTKMDFGFPSPKPDQRNIAIPGQSLGGQQGILDQPQPTMDFGFPSPKPDQRNIAIPGQSLDGQQGILDQPQPTMDFGFPSPKPDQRNIAIPGQSLDGQQGILDQPQPTMDFGFPSPTPDQRNIAIPGQSLDGQQGILDQPQPTMDFGFPSPTPDQRNISYPGQDRGGLQGFPDELEAKVDFGFPSATPDQRDIVHPGQDRGDQQEGFPDQPQPIMDTGLLSSCGICGQKQGFPDQSQAKMDLGFPSTTPHQRNIAFPGQDRGGKPGFPTQPQAKIGIGLPRPCGSCGQKQGFPGQPQANMDHPQGVEFPYQTGNRTNLGSAIHDPRNLDYPDLQPDSPTCALYGEEDLVFGSPDDWISDILCQFPEPADDPFAPEQWVPSSPARPATPSLRLREPFCGSICGENDSQPIRARKKVTDTFGKFNVGGFGAFPDQNRATRVRQGAIQGLDLGSQRGRPIRFVGEEPPGVAGTSLGKTILLIPECAVGRFRNDKADASCACTDLKLAAQAIRKKGRQPCPVHMLKQDKETASRSTRSKGKDQPSLLLSCSCTITNKQAPSRR